MTENIEQGQVTNTAGTETAALADLVAAQSEMSPAVMDCSVVYGGRPSRYASLKSVINACLPSLNRHGFALLFSVTSSDGNISAVVRLIHRTGFRLESDPFVVPAGTASARMNIQQAFGSASTYARRYALSAFLGITAEEDDDGNGADYDNSAAVRSNRRPAQQQEPARNPDLEAQAEEAAWQGTQAYQKFFGEIGKAARQQLQARHEEFKRMAAAADAMPAA